MYNTQKIADRIKALAKQRNITIGGMLSDLGLGVNSISDFSKGRALSSISLAKIADYLDCSIDELLGRNPSNHRINAENNSGTIGVVGHSNAPVNISSGSSLELSEQEKDFIRIFRSVSGKSQNQIMSLVYEIEEREKIEDNKRG